MGRVDLDVLNAAQAREGPDFTRDDDEGGQRRDTRDAERHPAQHGRAREIVLHQLRDREARPQGDEREEGGEQQRAPAEAARPCQRGGRHDDQLTLVDLRLEADARDGAGLALRLFISLGRVEHEGLRGAGGVAHWK